MYAGGAVALLNPNAGGVIALCGLGAYCVGKAIEFFSVTKLL